MSAARRPAARLGLAALLALAGCGQSSPPAEPTPSAAAPRRDLPPAPKENAVTAPTPQELVHAIRTLCDRVTEGADAPNAKELASSLGTVSDEGRSAVYVDPASPPFGKVVVTRDADGAAEDLTLTLVEPSTKLAAALAVPMGLPSFPPVVGGGAFRATWAVDSDASRPRTCMVSVAYVGVPDRLTLAGTVTEVGIRIDPRL